MTPIQQALPLPAYPLVAFGTSSTRARAGRFLKLLLAAVAVPLAIAVATPLVAALFVAFVLLSPLLLAWVLANARIQGEKERLQLAA